MVGGLAMAWGHCVAPLLLLLLATLGLGWRPHPEPGVPGLRHSYDCGLQGMQLLVFPRQGQTIRFKVVDEFGNEFEVNNCSICYHGVTAKPQGPAVFTTDYKGCHVLEKDGRSHLRVLVEAVLPNGHVDIAQDVTLVCPKPEHTWMTLVPPTKFSLSTPQASSLGLTAEHRSVHPPPASPSLGPGPTHPTWAPPHGGVLEQWEVVEPDYTGTHLTPEQCQGDTRHIPCIVKRSSKEACQQAGCCYNNTRDVPCYYGNTATVQCLRSGHFVLVVSQETALAHRVTLASVHLAYAPASCSPAQKTESFVVFHFPVTHCGTTAQAVGNQLIYENQLASVIDVQRGPQGSITRDGAFRIHIRCIFNASDFLPLQASVFSLPSLTSVTRPGPLRLQLRIAKDATFHYYYEEKDYPISKLLLEPLAVEVRLLQRTDPHLVLMLHRCWATPSANPFQQPQWPILSDGCPFEGDSYRTQIVALDGVQLPFPTHYQRFTVATFAFLDSGSQRALRGPVYFFCSASACSPTGLETCSTTCGSRTTRQRRSSSSHRDMAEPQDIVSSPGPVGFVDSYRKETALGPSGSTWNSNPRPLLWVVLLLAAAALVLGIGVSVSLRWARAQRPQEVTEGEQTQ